ncbi:Transcriptional regulator containing GAF, AAA-type ATPase, and DNA-binding Fis domains [Desulfuromusa kysingii]|uniref:Transcriptional regulator containing GAF, AAA-type ATPase, and DNA-binding Fis domains n=1 Tax=Desulfuromusa kysingii TaxID=37625 RepID=A0A1H4DF03_9BACT|nr:sigma 54-interacting transcriptional regulator [Desulfuromusa kysingii]SEA71423.1 Transcriptional regulator containing GAF, AAA-type ATPase, and DNA-binding Fis domains [Desulfuromusa kysingii]
MEDFDFYKDLNLCISSNLNPGNAWSKTFKFLASQFPIDAISLHSYDSQLASLHLQFLVMSDCYLEPDIIVPLYDDIPEIEQSEKQDTAQNFTHCSKWPVAQRHLNALKDYLGNADRAYLVMMLRTEEGVLGHLCLIGKTVDCFTAEHEHKIMLMQSPVSLAMMNMQRHRQTHELKHRLDLQRLQLAGEVKLLKNVSIIGRHSGLRKTMEMVEQLAGKEAPTLILGETGTGKELIADAVQRISPRTDKPYVKINCGAIPETLIDSELFGHQKGAFTGALTTKIGRFEQADGGTLFLDEVGELPPKAQVRLLRVLQNETIERVGGEKPIKVDVRIIAATNRPLETMLQQGTFREDLYYRLNVFPIQLPPLRERDEDIPLLVRHFINQFSQRLKLSDEIQLNPKCRELLQAYSWPGNVRELRNLVERALTISPKGPLNISRYLPQDSSWYISNKNNEDYMKSLVQKEVHKVLEEMDLKASTRQPAHDQSRHAQSLDSVMAEHICTVVEQCHGKINGPGGAAEVLEINPNTLRKRMEKLNIPYGYKR